MRESASTGWWFAPRKLAGPRSSPPWRIVRGKVVCLPSTPRSSAGRDRAQGRPVVEERRREVLDFRENLSVSANHSSDVVDALPGAEQVAKVVVVTVDEAFLLSVAIQSAHHSCHVLATKDGG